MYIQKRGIKFAVVDQKDNEVCWFDQLADACIVQRYMSNQSLPRAEEIRALYLLRMFDENGGGKVDCGGKKKETAGIPAELEQTKQR